MSTMKIPSKKEFAPGAFLFHEGDPSNCMYLIQKGTVAIRKQKPAGGHVEIARLYSNEVLGELSFFDRNPRSASAVALTPVEVLEIRFDALDKVYDGVPDYMKTIMASVADRLRKANDTIRRLQKNVITDSMPADTKADEIKHDISDIPAVSMARDDEADPDLSTAEKAKAEATEALDALTDEEN